MIRFTCIFACLLFACEVPGTINATCRPDGTCVSPTLVCDSVWGVCRAKEATATCHNDADCFCEACLQRCGNVGLRRCEYTDPSVWGSKPTVCECRQ